MFFGDLQGRKINFTNFATDRGARYLNIKKIERSNIEKKKKKQRKEEEKKNTEK